MLPVPQQSSPLLAPRRGLNWWTGTPQAEVNREQLPQCLPLRKQLLSVWLWETAAHSLPLEKQLLTVCVGGGRVELSDVGGHCTETGHVVEGGLQSVNRLEPSASFQCAVPVLALFFALIMQAQTQPLCCDHGIRQITARRPLCITLLYAEDSFTNKKALI